MSRLLQELRSAARALARSPGLATLAILTFAAGIGGTTAVFSVVDAVMLQPFPFERQDRLALLWERDEARGQPFVEVSYPSFLDWRAASQRFESMAAMVAVNSGFVWASGAEPLQLQGRLVSGDFFRVLGARAAHGRTLREEDNRPGATRVVVIGHGLWLRGFGGDPQVIGRTMTLDGTAFTIVGVMPAAFAYPLGAELWVPVVPLLPEAALARGVCWAVVIGRLRKSARFSEARAELDGIVAQLAATHDKDSGRGIVLTPLVEDLLGDNRPRLLLLLAGVGLFLLLACSNVAGLLLVRATTRQREIAIRIALGASRAALARQLLCESLVLSAVGGAAGVLLASWAVGAIVALGPASVPRLSDVTLDARVLLFALAASAASALLAGLAPAWHATRSDDMPREDLGGSVGAPKAHRLRGALVAAQVTLAVVLLFGAGLLVQSFVRLRGVDTGFDPRHLLTMEIGFSDKRAPQPEQRRARQAELLERVAAVPGVESAALVLLRPLWGHVGMDWYFAVEGQSDDDATHNPLVNLEAVTPGYFKTMGIPLLRGRDFGPRDMEGVPGVVIVSRRLAERYWPGQDPLGKRLKMPLPETPYHQAWLTVVGVAADARYRELQAARLDVYMSSLQSREPLRHLVVRTAGDPLALAAAVRSEVRALEPDRPVSDVATMEDIVDRALRGARFGAQTLAALAGLALVLAAVGLYGVMAQAAAQRTREIGVRMALGARARHVVSLVARQGLAPAAAGLGAGAGAALLAARFLRGVLFGIGPADPGTLAGVGASILAVALLASALPARRAARVDPVKALRHE